MNAWLPYHAVNNNKIESNNDFLVFANNIKSIFHIPTI